MKTKCCRLPVRILLTLLAALLMFGSVGCSSKSYTAQDIAERCGWEKYSEREFEIGGVMTHNIWNSGVKNNDYDYMDFYICPSNASAKRVFRYIRKNWFSEITKEGTGYVQGWEAGVCDAYIEKLVYISGNIVVTVDVKCLSAWADDIESDSGSDDRDDVEFQNRIKQELFENW